MELKELGLYECDWVGYEKVIKRIDNGSIILSKYINGKWGWVDQKGINELYIPFLNYKYNLKIKHYESFKTFIKKSTGEYGHIEYRGDYFQIIDFFTSSIPTIIHPNTTIEGIKNTHSKSDFEYSVYDDKKEDYMLVGFNWDEHFPKDWELVEVNINYTI